ncbi:GUP1 Membrane-bound O-acyltransferase GUP1 [Candida maltosa Xu316]
MASTQENGSLLNLEDRERLTAPLPIEDYDFFNYISYLTYTPLFIAGPIVTFNDYIYQSNYQQSATTKDYRRIVMYLIRFIFCLLTMEFILHFMYVVAASKAKAWDGDSPFQISMLGMFNLNIIWLKLLIPWRLFRLWALLDGIDPPENMIRCMDNNFSALAFWRAWHRSYNRWVIRYIYIPMGGGGKYRILNSLLVFSFVAIWHDIELKLLMWGWLVVVFLIPEIVATLVFSKYSEQWWYRYLCGVGAVINIWMMMIANLVGFCLGTDGMWQLLHDLFKTFDGVRFLLISSFALFVGAQIMFEIRESEMRKGINVRC